LGRNHGVKRVQKFTFPGFKIAIGRLLSSPVQHLLSVMDHLPVFLSAASAARSRLRFPGLVLLADVQLLLPNPQQVTVDRPV
jgi:hypothetical protein